MELTLSSPRNHSPPPWDMTCHLFQTYDRGLRKYIIFDKRANTNVQVSIFLTKIQTQNRITQNNFRLSHLSPWASQDTSGFIATNKGSVTVIMSSISFWKENVIYVLFVNPLTLLLLQLQLLASKFKLVECSLKGFLLSSEFKIFDCVCAQILRILVFNLS